MTADASPPLPRLVVLTDRRLARAAGHDLCPLLEAAVDAGVRCVVLRERDMHPASRAQVAASLHDMLHDVGGSMLIASGPSAWADGVHLSSRDRMPVPRPSLVGRSCHAAADLDTAIQDGLDYVFVSPVFATPSKPGYGPALGLDTLARLCTTYPLPIYALGGITEVTAPACLDAGAAGVVVMGAVMASPQPAEAARLLVEAVDRWQHP
ncbi:MAG: thiamine phosphate synthase [Acidimicrobiia bacterium]|nr:thiamine phosphate synthase [Acidimicrobiia bacterium]